MNQISPHPPAATAAAGPRCDDILVVDDNRANLAAIEAALGDLGDHIVSVSSGEEALRRLLDHDFALVLLDVQMPGMGGFETARLMRSRERTRHIPIIFVTAFDHDERKVLEGYELGAVDFLFKPIVPEVLRAKAGVFVELRRQSDEVHRQAELLRQHERREHERALAEERSRWEAEVLRRQMEEHARVAERMAAINQKLADADRRKDEFLAMLAHELRNPLMPITTGLGLARTCEIDNPVINKVLGVIERQTTHLTRLVDDLLDVARITSGKIELRKAPLDLAQIVRRAIEVSQPLVDERQHELVASFPDESITLQGDEDRLAQVVSNLINNAAKYTEPGGRIEVGVETGPDEARVRVTDNGQGMSEELLEDVFDVFVQKNAGEGLGLDLPLVRQLVELHGGEVLAKSTEGEGSEFLVRLPLGDVPVPDRVSVHSAEPEEEPLRIVVVEDNDDVRELVCQLLLSHGHDVTNASGGVRGAELILERKPDVAFVDIGMPDLDGYSVARRVREQLPEAPPRLVALTGYGQEKDRARAREAGFDAHLVKPVSSTALLRVLNEP